MITKDYSQFEKLTENIGKKVLVEFISAGKIQYKNDILRDVEPFHNIVIPQAIITPYDRLYFIESDQAIITVLDNDGNMIYHNPNISRSYSAEPSVNVAWTKYFSGFYEESLEGKCMDNYYSKLDSYKKLDKERQELVEKGMKVINKESKDYWKEICNHMDSNSRWVIIPALEILEGLAKGYHLELDKIDKKYGLTGHLNVATRYVVHKCALNPHPVIEHELSRETLPKRPKRPIY